MSEVRQFGTFKSRDRALASNSLNTFFVCCNLARPFLDRSRDKARRQTCRAACKTVRTSVSSAGMSRFRVRRFGFRGRSVISWVCEPQATEDATPMTPGAKLSDFWSRFQGTLFPAPAEAASPLPGTHRRLVAACALAWAFPAKARAGHPDDAAPMDRLGADPSLRRLCCWSRLGDIPGEATFSWASGGEAEEGRSPAGKRHEPGRHACRPSRSLQPGTKRNARNLRGEPGAAASSVSTRLITGAHSVSSPRRQ